MFKRIRTGFCLALASLMLVTSVPALALDVVEEDSAALNAGSVIGLLEIEEYLLSETEINEYERGGYTLNDIREILQQGDALNNIREMLKQGDIVGFERVYKPDGGPITYQTSVEEMVDFFDSIMAESDVMTEIDTLSNNFGYAVRPIIGAGRSCDESIVLVLLGDGFTAGHGYGQIGNFQNPGAGTFLRSAHEFAETITTLYPFNLFSDVFKIYAVETPSTHSGIRMGVGAPYAGTYLGTYFNSAGSLRMTVQGRVHALNISNWISSGAIMTQVIANSREFGGAAFWWGASHENPNYATRNTVGVSSRFLGHSVPGWNRPGYHFIVVHEIGHNFGKLVDEHATGFGYPNNLTHANMARITDTNAQLRWGHWVGHAGIIRRTLDAPVGYIFPSTSGTCKMQGWHFGFCAVCRAELTRRMAMISGETFEAGRRPDGTIRPATPNVTITSQHNRILPSAFHGNTSLQTIQIPASVTEIGDFAFIGATGLRTIVNINPPQQINATTFAGINRANIDVMIPIGATQAYIAAGWTGFRLVESRFTDVPPSHWAFNHIRVISDANIMSGVGFQLFDPNRTITRAEFAVLLGNTHQRMGGTIPNVQDIGHRFHDMAIGVGPAWAIRYVAWASDPARGLIVGTGPNTFSPHNNITREQAARLLFLYESYRLGQTPAYNLEVLNGFADDDNISDWARSAMAWAVGAGIISGRPGNVLMPLDGVLRSETAALIHLYFGSIDGLHYLTSTTPGLSICLGMNRHTFPSANVGYSAQAAHSITVRNRGTQATGTIRIMLSGANANRFTLSTNLLTSIPAGNTTRSFTVRPNNGLAPGVHTATVTVYGVNLPAQSFDMSFTVALNAPVAPTVASRTTNSITLNAITAPAGFTTQYRRSTGANNTWQAWTTNPVFSGLSANTEFRFQARLQSATGNSVESATLTTRTVPNAPAAPTVASRTTNSITLNTVAASAGFTTQYRRSTGANNTWQAWTTNPVFTGLTANQEFRFQVRFQSTTGSSVESTTLTTRTVPNAPATPTVASRTANSITLNTITAPAGFTTQYRRSTGANNTWQAWTTSPNFTGLTANQEFRFQARFFSATGSSLESGTLIAHTLPNVPTSINTWAALRDAINAAPANVQTTIQISDNFTAPAGVNGNAITIPLNRNIRLVSTAAGAANMRTLTQANNQRHFIVNGTLTLGNNITLSGGASPGGTTYRGGVLVQGILNLQAGAAIRNNRATNGGGVDIVSGGMFYMSGGIISGNEATHNGGGVQINTEDGGWYCCSPFTMSGGTITGNFAHNGGGIWLIGTAVQLSPSAIVIWELFHMYGGEITGNDATNRGGGIHITYHESVMWYWCCCRGNPLRLHSGTIMNNTAWVDGADIYEDLSLFWRRQSMDNQVRPFVNAECYDGVCRIVIIYPNGQRIVYEKEAGLHRGSVLPFV